MKHHLAVILLSGHGDAGPTLDSVRRDLDARVQVLSLAGVGRGDPVDGTASMSAPEALGAAQILAFARTGDRWRPGALEHRLRPLAAHPTAALSVAGHVIVNAAGEPVLEVPAPMPPYDPAQFLLRPSVEPSAALVKSSALDAMALELLTRPGGDAAVWSELARSHGLVPSREIAADVLLDPARHGHAPQARTAALLEAVRSLGRDQLGGASVVRRELLRRLYLEPDSEATEVAPELAELLSAQAGRAPAAVTADLLWMLDRQRDALRAERVRWAQGEVDPEEELPTTADEELWDARLDIQRLRSEVSALASEVRRLDAEVELRDAQLAQQARSTDSGQL
jgi:hypothetical protein